MSENSKAQAGKKFSISFRIDNGVIDHNNRKFVASNVVKERIPDNITYKSEDIKEKYSELFSKAVREYNDKQKRADRKIDDYYKKMKSSKKEKTFQEIVVQIGDLDNCGIGKENFEDAKKVLDEFMRDFEKRNPNLKVFNAVMHLDEATPHLHIDFIPICHTHKQGLSTSVSFRGALNEQGIFSKNRSLTEQTLWAEKEKQTIQAIMKKYGLYREYKNIHREHLSVDEYKTAKQQVEQMNAHINELKKKNPNELTTEEAETIKNQNDFLRSEIQKRDEKIRRLSAKAAAKFIPFDVYSQEKISFISEALDRQNISYVAERNTIYVPEYALKVCGDIAAKYRPINSDSIRENIRTDIDILVYSSQNFTELLDKLRERGYEIKDGKYLAVKSPKAQRFVRLKSLGEEYEPVQLEKRIAMRDIFTRAVERKSQKANEAEQKIYTAISQTIIAVTTFKFTPRKSVPKKIYTFENDETVNFLSQQLINMSELGLNSREKIFETAEKLQKSIAEKSTKIKELYAEIPNLKARIADLKRNNFSADNDELKTLQKRLELIPTHAKAITNEISDEQMKLGRVNDVLRTYESIIEGNFIDNMVKAERERLAKNEKKQAL